MTYRKKLIEVALPLEEINIASAREKSIRHGHPSTLHLWWARRPLATCRAVLFSSIIDDPGEDDVPLALLEAIDRLPLAHKYRHLADEVIGAPDETEATAASIDREKVARRRRYKLFTFIERLVQWENSNDDETLRVAHELIWAATGGNPPPVMDPFCGGGSIPLEAERLGLVAHASDLNPVAILITKAMIEIPPKFADMPPLNPESRGNALKTWQGIQGLADDIRYYGKWMRTEAEKRIGHLYPRVKVTAEMAAGRPDLQSYIGRDLRVIAWLWARTSTCPNPACGAEAPLIRTYYLSSKDKNEAWLEPVPVHSEKPGVTFKVKVGKVEQDKKGLVSAGTCLIADRDIAGRPLKAPKKVKATFVCATCRQAVLKGAEIDSQANSVGLGVQPLAIVAEGRRERIYLPFVEDQARVALDTARSLGEILHERLPTEPCRGTFASNAQGRIYGFKRFKDYFTDRQLVSLATFSGLVKEARDKARRDAEQSTLDVDIAEAYSDALATYLAFAVDKMVDTNTTLCSWQIDPPRLRATFGRQGIAMTWDFAEANCFGDAAGDFGRCVGSVAEVLDNLPPLKAGGVVAQLDARSMSAGTTVSNVVSSDPPYYDNIGYSDLSDFFYIWLRRSLADTYPNLFTTTLTPKASELIASSYRHEGSAERAREFFERGLHLAFERMRENSLAEYPTTIYYAFKQAESVDGEAEGTVETASTGWESMLFALLGSGFLISGTWPTRTELATRNVASGTNALASCIVLVCRPRPSNAPKVTRREFVAELHRELHPALQKLTQGNIAPVDLAQAAIGPGMAVFSRYSAILESDGKPMSIRTALGLINQALDEALAEQEGWYDPQTRWAVAWFQQRGFGEGPYGEAEVLANAKSSPVGTMVDAKILRSGGGKVKLLSREELPAEYDPASDKRATIWEATQQLVRALDQGGELEAARMMRRYRESRPMLEIERARELAYRLYLIADSRRHAQEARVYNALVLSWTDIESVSQTDSAAWYSNFAINSGLFEEL